MGLSGGVDSAAAIKLLLKKKYEVIGVYLQMHTEGERLYRVSYGLGSGEDINSAYQCALHYDIPLYVYNAKDSFEKYVIADFLEEYSNGRTPNPCTVCNYYCKIASLLEAADLLDAQYIATGHYAGVGYENGRYFPYMGQDLKKDQSYMLWRLSQQQLERLIFPLQSKSKQQVKAIAQKESLLAAGRKESADICFIPNGDYASYIESRVGKFPCGDFIAPDGSVIGKHKGIIHYTVGQRKGLNISYGQPLFVKRIDSTENKIYLGTKGQEYSTGFTAQSINFCFANPQKQGEFDCTVKVRYAAAPVQCHVKIENKRLTAVFDTPQRAITPGQSAVFYSANKVLLGAVIEQAF